MDLIIFYSPDKSTMTYYINHNSNGYRIECPFAYIKSIFLDMTEGEYNGGIVIELLNPPYFFMDLTATTTSGFFSCGDFTEDQQASRVMTHRLGGNPKVMSGQLEKLISLEAFMYRHSTPNPILEQFHLHSMSALVSPTARPSSQPIFTQPHAGLFQETQWGITHSAVMIRGPGHKRQSSHPSESISQLAEHQVGGNTRWTLPLVTINANAGRIWMPLT